MIVVISITQIWNSPSRNNRLILWEIHHMKDYFREWLGNKDIPKIHQFLIFANVRKHCENSDKVTEYFVKFFQVIFAFSCLWPIYNLYILSKSKTPIEVILDLRNAIGVNCNAISYCSGYVDGFASFTSIYKFMSSFLVYVCLTLRILLWTSWNIVSSQQLMS